MSILLRILLVIYAVVFIFAAVMSVMVAINNEMLGNILPVGFKYCFESLFRVDYHSDCIISFGISHFVLLPV